MKSKGTKGLHSNLRRSPVAHACLTFSMLLAASAAQAGAGWGDSFGPDGVTPIRVPTFYAHTPSGQRDNTPLNDKFLPAENANGNFTGAALRKFVDPLPVFGRKTDAAGNYIGPKLADGTEKYIPTAVATSWVDGNGVTTNDEYYEIAVVEYKEKLHSNLANPTTLRGYVQIYPKGKQPAGALALTQNGTAVKFTTGEQVYAYDKPHYLGPAIVAKRGTAVRLKFYNFLPVGRAVVTNAATGAVNRNGDLFIPTDVTLPGAGVGPDGSTAYTQNRAEIHLHGGDTPWISDGTPHQWITPAGEGDAANPLSLAATMGATNTFLGQYIKGVSQQNVPDMPAPEAGAATYYFPNNQSGRLMFFHDHSFGLTRLNFYAGEAAPYVLVDDRQEALLSASTVAGFPGANETIPLVIQDKTFVPQDIALQDAFWNNTNTSYADPSSPNFKKIVPKNIWGGESDMWYPHVYEINQDPSNGQDGTNAVGRWDWGPYFWPVFPALYNIPTGAVDDVTITPEAWMDTPLVNGVAYPYAEVDPKAYRLKILNAANDRMWNLSFFVADAAVSRVEVSAGGSNYVANVPPVVDATGAITTPAVINTPVTFTKPEDPLGVTATGEAIVVNGAVVGITITNAGSGYALAPTVTIGGTGSGALASAVAFTEVKMVPAVPQVAQATPACATDAAGNELPPSPTNQCWPSEWPTDGRDGGVPDPLTAGPSWYQIGSEGGLLPHVAQIDAKPMGYEYNRRSITVLNTFTFGLFIGNAERADTVVDFSQYKGKTLIVYNDSPAPVPAFDPRNDHWTGKPDESGAGSVETPRPGFGPNTRTVMQFRVSNATPAAPLDVAALDKQLAATYGATQEAPVVGQAHYNTAFGTGYSDSPQPDGTKAFATIFTGSLQEPAFKFTPGDSNGLYSSITVTKGGSGYMTPPAVTLSAPAAGGVQATADASLRISSVRVDSPGSGYIVAPLVRFSNLPITNANGVQLNDPTTGLPLVANGSGAEGITTLKVVGVNLSNTGAGYTAAPAVTFSAPTGKNGVRATGHAVMETQTRRGVTTLTGRIASIAIDVAGSGYAGAPSMTIGAAPAGGTNAKANSLAGVAEVILTSPNPKKPDLLGGGGYDNLNFISVVFSTPSNVPNAATATVNGGSVFDITLKHSGSGYAAAPSVSVAASPTNDNATAATAIGGSILVKSKAIQELFDPTYGRMNATLGIELPFTSALSQTTIPLGYVDPLTEEFDNGETQIWKITHNGVDSHPVHFHLLNVQVINRIGWDGTIKPPKDNEYGWKETVKMHPLEDIVVAVRAKKPIIGGQLDAATGKISETARSFGIPLSQRLRDPSQPEGSPAGFTQIDPATGLPATIVNGVENYGWEYVWHCHILGHEENDFMRPVKFNANEAKPVAPALASIAANVDSSTKKVTLKWIDRAVSETSYEVSRRPAGASGTATLLANASSYADPDALVSGTNYVYTIKVNGVAGSDSTNVNVSIPVPPAAPSNLKAVGSAASQDVTITFTDNSNNETQFLLERNTGSGWAPVGAPLASANVNGTGARTVTVPTAYLTGVTNQYRITAQVVSGAVTLSSAPSNTATLVFVPPAPASIGTPTIARIGGLAGLFADKATVTWGSAGAQATGYAVQYSVNAGGTWTNAATTTTASTASFNVLRGLNYLFRVQATNANGGSAYVTTTVAVAAP
jgi:FtsP/CotA-like multicopper oxidase with cupredoxin domain